MGDRTVRKDQNDRLYYVDGEGQICYVDEDEVVGPLKQKSSIWDKVLKAPVLVALIAGLLGMFTCSVVLTLNGTLDLNRLLEQLGLLSVTPTSIAEEAPTAVVVVPTDNPDVQGTLVTTSPSDTPEATFPVIATLEVPGSAENGVEYTCQETGTYVVTITGGAYSPWRGGIGPKNGQWRTFLYIYRNCDAEWGSWPQGWVGPIPSENENCSTASVGMMELPDGDRSSAEATGIGQNASIYCETGEYLRFVPIDERTAYSDNESGVLLSIQFHD